MKKEKTKNLKIEKELEKFQRLCEENLAGWQRERADFENYRRRMEKRSLEFIKFANKELLLKILPILDSFGEALKHTPKGWEKTSWTQGIICIKKHLENILKAEGLEEIVIKRGDKFDPCVCEAIEKRESQKERKECRIIGVLQKGYRLNNEVIRPAKVKVS